MSWSQTLAMLCRVGLTICLVVMSHFYDVRGDVIAVSILALSTNQGVGSGHQGCLRRMGRVGGHLYFRLDIILVKGLSNTPY